MENFNFFLDGGHASYAVAFSDLVNLTLYANCRNTGTLVEDLAGTTKADPAPAHRARAPLFEHFKGCIFENFESITRKNFIVINMQG